MPDADRFIELLTPLREQLERFCRRAVTQSSDVEDVLQTAVSLAFRDFDRFSEGTNFRAWIFRYVTLESLNRNRAMRRQDQALSLEAEIADPSSDFVAFETTAWHNPDALLEHLGDRFDQVVLTASAELPAKERAIFLLRAIGEFSYREIAEIYGIPRGTVMGLLSRARKSLRVKLGEYATEQGFLNRGNTA